ncbi:hypothetical protein [Roseobacter sp. S98]|uniref:hypothetical protein n=1 Tax=Roseobacter algicola (ex Choi et al. 2025) (nom. illeg.) TaxID=3092138 RepID=UPI0035C68430
MSADHPLTDRELRLAHVAALQEENEEYHRLRAAYVRVNDEIRRAESGSVQLQPLEISQLRVRRARLRAQMAVMLAATLHDELSDAS